MRNESSRTSMDIVLDSSAILAYLYDEPGADLVGKLLKKKRNGTLLVSVIQYGEVLYSTELLGGPPLRERVLAFLADSPLMLVPATPEQAQWAAYFKAKGGLAYPDAFALALAKLQKATLVTKDGEFKKFEKEARIRWIGKR